MGTGYVDEEDERCLEKILIRLIKRGEREKQKTFGVYKFMTV